MGMRHKQIATIPHGCGTPPRVPMQTPLGSRLAPAGFGSLPRDGLPAGVGKLCSAGLAALARAESSECDGDRILAAGRTLAGHLGDDPGGNLVHVLFWRLAPPLACARWHGPIMPYPRA